MRPTFEQEKKQFIRDVATQDVLTNTRLWLSEKFHTLKIIHEKYENSTKKIGGKEVTGTAYVFWETDVDPKHVEVCLIQGREFDWNKVKELVTIFQPADDDQAFDITVTPGIFSKLQIADYLKSMSPEAQEERKGKMPGNKLIQKKVNKLKARQANLVRSTRKAVERRARISASSTKRKEN